MKRIRESPSRYWGVPVLLAFPLVLAILLGGYVAVTLWPPDGLVDPWWRPAIVFGLFILSSVSLGLLAAWEFGAVGAGETGSSERLPDIVEKRPGRADLGQPRDGRTPRDGEGREDSVTDREALLLR